MDDKKLTKTVLINIQSSVVLQYSGLPINSISIKLFDAATHTPITPDNKAEVDTI